jgi:hypothetical protein
MPSEVRTDGGAQGCLRSRRPAPNSLPAMRPSVPPSGPPTEVPTIGTAITALSKTVAFASRDRRAHHRRTKRRYLNEREAHRLDRPLLSRSAAPAAYSSQNSISLRMRQIETATGFARPRPIAPYRTPRNSLRALRRCSLVLQLLSFEHEVSDCFQQGGHRFARISRGAVDALSRCGRPSRLDR